MGIIVGSILEALGFLGSLDGRFVGRVELQHVVVDLCSLCRVSVLQRVAKGGWGVRQPVAQTCGPHGKIIEQLKPGCPNE